MKHTLPTPSVTAYNKDKNVYYIIRLSGETDPPSFGLFIDLSGKPIKKSTNPYDFDELIFGKE